MTVFPKGSLISNKNEVAKLPLVEEVACPEAKVAVPPLPESAEPRRHRIPGPLRRCGVMIFHLMNICMLVMLFVVMSVLIYRQYIKTTSMHRYQGYCTIPIEFKNQEHLIDFHVMPPRWSSEPELHVVSTSDAATAERILSVLRERLDIDRDGMTEKISVFNNGNQVNFIHDFTNNFTNIVDDERCFITDLDLELVLEPDAFIAGIERGDEFDVSRVRSGLRAALPALQDLAALPGLPASCRARPTYRLQQDRTRLMHKRAADVDAAARPHDYVHFSGKHIHEIDIANMQQLLQHEKNNTA